MELRGIPGKPVCKGGHTDPGSLMPPDMESRGCNFLPKTIIYPLALMLTDFTLKSIPLGQECTANNMEIWDFHWAVLTPSLVTRLHLSLVRLLVNFFVFLHIRALGETEDLPRAPEANCLL